MQISFQQLRTIMKESGIPVYRDEAPTTAAYPYIVYEFVNEQYKRASDKVLYELPMYQVALITKGTESDIKPLKDAFKSNKVYFEPFEGGPYDENDLTINQFVTYVRCVNE